MHVGNKFTIYKVTSNLVTISKFGAITSPAIVFNIDFGGRGGWIYFCYGRFGLGPAGFNLGFVVACCFVLLDFGRVRSLNCISMIFGNIITAFKFAKTTGKNCFFGVSSIFGL